jgi:opine dehydrogenase
LATVARGTGGNEGQAMNVTILGAGGIGLGMAAVLIGRGHAVKMWTLSGDTVAPFRAGKPLVVDGIVTGEYRPTAAASAQDAVGGAEVVLLAVPGNGHRAMIDAIAPHVVSGQIVVISSHCSLSALYLSQRLAARGVACPIAAWATTVVTGRRKAPGAVNMTTLRKEVDVATVPAAESAQALAACRTLFGDRFKLRDDLLAVSLSNLNPPVHMANSLCNLTRMERGEAWSNYGCITDAVGRLVEALDRERLAIAAAFGLSVRTVQDHLHLSFDLPRGTVAEMAREQDKRRGGKPPGPTTLDHRYITEDVPFGLVPLIALARAAKVPVPLHEGGVALFGALYARDFAGENDILPELGLERLSASQLHALARDGVRPR